MQACMKEMCNHAAGQAAEYEHDVVRASGQIKPMDEPMTGLEALAWDDLMLEDMALQLQVGQALSYLLLYLRLPDIQ